MKKILSFCTALLFALVPFSATAMAANIECAWFPAYTMNVNQLAYESYSHGDQNAIDILPEGDVFAPFSGTIVYMDSSWGYVVLQSNEKVYWADGSIDYMTVGFMHDEYIGDLYVGMELEQGQAFYQAGGMGAGNPDEYGDHVHITVHRGKVTRGHSYGNGDVYAYEAFFINKKITTNFTGKGEGRVEAGNSVYNGAPNNWSGYWIELGLEGCVLSPTYAKVQVIKEGYLKSLPYSIKTRDDSISLNNGNALPIHENLVINAVCINTEGNIWYRTSFHGENGWLYSGDVEIQEILFDTKIENASYPTGTLSKGSMYPVAGIITTSHSLEKIFAAVYEGSDTSGTPLLQKTEDIEYLQHYSISDAIDNAMTFNTLPSGDYTFVIRVTEMIDDPMERLCYNRTVDLISQPFAVS